MPSRTPQASKHTNATAPIQSAVCRREAADNALILLIALLVLVTPGPLRAQAPGAQVSISGTVLENHDGCVRDGACFLKVRAAGVVWQVTYHPGEGERRCVRNDVTDVGLALRPGDSITATGRRIASPGLNALDVCSSSSDLLRLVKAK